jgi:arylsulfatase A-like enzyme
MSALSRRAFLNAPIAAAAAARARMNVVLILVDDWGWTDAGCYGSRYYETPNIDRLAASGMRFTQAYSACTVCSPSRAAILTGRYPARLHITDWIAGHQYPWAKLKPPDWRQHLPLEEVTLAERFRSAGYATASIGKWHLGGPDYYPEKQGFDINAGGTHRGQPPSYFSPYGIETLKDGPRGEYLTDREVAEALAFIEANRRRPLFVYLPHHAVHTPLEAKAERIAKYERKAAAGARQGRPEYAAMIDSLDENVGRVLGALERLGLADRTVVAITADNGGLISSTSNAPLRAGKGSAYEGGVRVPLIVRWPGVTRAGSVSEAPAIGLDLYATLAEAAASAVRSTDGVNLTPVLAGAGSLPRDTLFWHYPHYHPGGATPYGAIREHDLKLIEFYEDGRTELYDLAADPGEKKDLSEAKPGDARRLRSRLAAWRRDCGAQMPVPNPDYDPRKATQRAR